MVFGVMPAALADETVTASVTAPQSVKAGDTLSMSVNVSGLPANADMTYQWTGDVTGKEKSISWPVPADTTAESLDGTVIISYSYRPESSDPADPENPGTDTDPVTGTVEASYHVQVEQVTVAYKAQISPQTLEMNVGGEDQLLVVTVTDQKDQPVSAKEITWSSDDENVATVTRGSVKAVAAGTAKITAHVVFPDGSEQDLYCDVKVSNTYTISADDITVFVGETADIVPTVKDAAGQVVTNASVGSSIKSGGDYITLEGLTVKGVKTGVAYVTLSYQPAGESNPATKEVKVTVTDGGIVCDNYSAPASYTNTHTLTPSYGKNGTYLKDVSFTYSAVGAGKVDANGTVTCSGAGLTTVTITALIDNKSVDTKTVYVSFYADQDIEVTMKNGLNSFTFGSTTALTNGKALSSQMLTTLNDNTAVGLFQYGVLFDTLGTSTTAATLTIPTGTSSGSNPTKKIAVLSDLSNVTLTVNSKSSSKSFTFGYTFRNGIGTGDVILGAGTVTVNIGQSGGDIVYETDYSTPITFDEDDFEDFWNAYYTAASNTLSYVQFGVDSTTPKYGTLYTTSSKGTKVTSTMKFQPNYRSSSSYYDLDAVYYVPSTSYTSAYSVEIPFTAYGGTTTASYTLSGTVVIDLNNATTTITSRGVVLGSGTTSIADMMVSDYKSKTNMDLSYVTFTLPDVEDGRLFYNYSSILNSTRVAKTDAFYVSPTTSQLSLDKVAFIPAAGKTGKVTLSYTGYDKNGKNPYSGKIVLTVTAKTKSVTFTDVTTTYSWAADSIDFLYYEDVVNGTSSTKFGPSASITRGDFMIMLYRAFLESDYKNYNVTSNFADVTKGTTTYSQETYQAVGVAKYLGIAKGDGTKFNPKSSITREEAMTLIYRTLEAVKLDLEYTTSKTTSSFTDYSSVSSYARDSISYLIRHGIVIGSNNKISPKSNITRAEMAVILHRVLTY